MNGIFLESARGLVASRQIENFVDKPPVNLEKALLLELALARMYLPIIKQVLSPHQSTYDTELVNLCDDALQKIIARFVALGEYIADLNVEIPATTFVGIQSKYDSWEMGVAQACLSSQDKTLKHELLSTLNELQRQSEDIKLPHIISPIAAMHQLAAYGNTAQDLESSRNIDYIDLGKLTEIGFFHTLLSYTETDSEFGRRLRESTERFFFQTLNIGSYNGVCIIPNAMRGLVEVGIIKRFIDNAGIRNEIILGQCSKHTRDYAAHFDIIGGNNKQRFNDCMENNYYPLYVDHFTAGGQSLYQFFLDLPHILGRKMCCGAFIGFASINDAIIEQFFQYRIHLKKSPQHCAVATFDPSDS